MPVAEVARARNNVLSYRSSAHFLALIYCFNSPKLNSFRDARNAPSSAIFLIYLLFASVYAADAAIVVVVVTVVAVVVVDVIVV